MRPQSTLPPSRREARPLVSVVALLLLILLSACSSKAPKPPEESARVTSPVKKKPQQQVAPGGLVRAPQGSGYYKDDGPHAYIPANLELVPDAEPRVEPFHPPTLRPYTALGQRFEPMTELNPFREQGRASWYGRRFHGNPTATGEPYDMYAMTAAHPTLPLPSFARVTNLENGRSVVVRVNDRGPFLRGRVIDLSYAAAHRLDFINAGSAMVEVEAITHEDIQAMSEPQEPVRMAARAPADRAGGAQPADAAAMLRVSAPAAAATDASGPYLQLGAFSTSDNARGLAARVRHELQLYPDRVHLFNDGQRYRLQIGPFATADEARNEAGRIAMLMNLQPFVVFR